MLIVLIGLQKITITILTIRSLIFTYLEKEFKLIIMDFYND